VEVDGPRDGGRLRPDGQRIAWRTILLADGATPLPFVIEDVTQHDLRVPPGPATEHALDVTGVAGVTILVPDLDRAATAYEALLARPGSPAASPIPGVRRARRFPLGPQWIELAEPETDATELQAHIHDRGAAPYDVILAGDEGAGALPLDLMHRARIRVESPTAVSDW
jgi:hypothetical protein